GQGGRTRSASSRRLRRRRERERSLVWTWDFLSLARDWVTRRCSLHSAFRDRPRGCPGEIPGASGLLPGRDRILEESDPLVCPGTVARHPAVTREGQNRLAQPGDIVRPEVELGEN